MIGIEFKVKKKDKNYTVIDNGIFKDTNLSYKAKGLLCTLLSLPNDWKISIEGLAKLSTDGNTSVSNTLNELHKNGYLAKRRVHKNGRISGWIYTIYEERQDNLDESDIVEVENQLSQKAEKLNSTLLQDPQNQVTCNQQTCNPVQLNTNILSTNRDKSTLSKDSVRTSNSSETFSFGFSEEKTKSKPKKKTNDEEYLDACLLIDNFTDDLKLREKLKELFRNKKDECSKKRYHFHATTCKQYLEELSEVDDKLGAVKLSIQYSNTMKVMQPNNSNSKSNSNDSKYIQIKRNGEVVEQKKFNPDTDTLSDISF